MGKWNEENAVDMVGCDIRVGRLCVFKPIEDESKILFGHMAGAVVDNFKDMSFMYVLTSGDEYYFARKVIEHKTGMHNASSAEKFFKEKYGVPHGYTWGELYDKALDAGCGEAALESKDTAKAELRRLIVREKGIDIAECECPDDEIEFFLHGKNILFDGDGNLICVG